VAPQFRIHRGSVDADGGAALVAAVLAGKLARRYVRAWRPGATAAELRG